MVAPLLETVGVEAVVEGLSSFTNDVRQINDLIEGLKLPATGIEKAFGGITSAIGGFGREILNVVETALGVMLRDTIEWIIGKLGEMGAAAFEAGNEFQLLKMRLLGFNLQDLVDSGQAYDEAMTNAIALTKEQLSWVMKLAAITPFDATDIGNIFSLAKSYSFTTDESKKLTKNILDFTAAMGLTGVEAERVIINLGQMAQRGKITTREMNDLARGAFVPISDILDRVAAKLKITTAQLTKDISKPGGGVDPQLFFDAFNEMIETEVRFAGGAVRMAHTFSGAMENIRQTIRDVIGGLIIMPGFLDPVGKVLGDIMDAVGEHWDEITTAAQNVGDTIGSIVQQLISTFLPSAEGIASGLVGGLNSLSSWIEEHRNDIISFFLGIGNVIKDDIIPWIRDTLIPTIGTILTWVDTNGPTIKEFFSTLGEIIGTVFSNLTGGAFEGGKGSGIAGFLDTLKNIMNYVILHKEGIATFVTSILRIALAFQIGVTIANTLVGALSALLGILLALINPVVWLALAFTAMIANILTSFGNLKANVANLQSVLGNFIAKAVEFATRLWTSIKDAVDKIITSFRQVDWFGIGRSAIQGIVNGIVSMGSAVWQSAWNIGQTALSAIKKALGIRSPSAAFEEVGNSAMDGLTVGIKSGTLATNDALKRSMATLTISATSLGKTLSKNLDIISGGIGDKLENTSKSLALAVKSSINVSPSSVPVSDQSSGITNNNTSTTTNNSPVVNNLNIVTNACREPIIADFRMLAGFA